MVFDLQWFADSDGGQGPDIPEELQGLPNRELVAEILREEGLAESQTDADAGEQAAEAEAGQPERSAEARTEVKGEEMEFWRKKAEQMERAMYEERERRKKERDLREAAERRLQDGEKARQQAQLEPWKREVMSLVDEKLRSVPALQQLHGYFERQEQERQMATFLEAKQYEARQRYPDFDEVTAPIVTAVKQSPELARYFLGQEDPAEAAYTYGIRFKFEQARAAEQQKQAGKLEQMVRHLRAGQVNGSAGLSPEGVDPDKMSTAEWEELRQTNPKLIQKLLMGG